MDATKVDEFAARKKQLMMKSLNTAGRLIVAFCGVFLGMAYVVLLPEAAFLLFQHQNPGVALPDSNYDTDTATVIMCSLPVYYILGACTGSAIPLVIFRKWSSAAKFLAWSGILAAAALLVLFAIHIYPAMGRPADGSIAPVNFGTPAFMLALVNVFAGVVLLLATQPGDTPPVTPLTEPAEFTAAAETSGPLSTMVPPPEPDLPAAPPEPELGGHD